MSAVVEPVGRSVGPRSVALVIVLAGFVAALTLGLRHSFGLFLEPVTRDLQFGRETFGFAIALQNLIWGFAQPVAGAIADRYGSGRVIFVSGALYAAGLALAAVSADPLGLYLTLGVLVGLGLSGTTFAVVLGAVGRRVPPERRTTALGLASLGGSIGIFLSVPGTHALIAQAGWMVALWILAGVVALVCLAAPGLGGRPERTVGEQSFAEAMREAAGHRGFVMLTMGFFVCGFQLAFVGTHLPAYLLDAGQTAEMGSTALAVIALANIAGAYACGRAGDAFSKKKLLALLYLARAGATTLFLLLPMTPASIVGFAAVMGLTWLGTVPLTSGIVAQIFGPRYLATLVGVVLVVHQIGSFLGAWLGGLAFDALGSYEPVWILAIAAGVLAALIHWPIDERPIQRAKPAEA